MLLNALGEVPLNVEPHKLHPVFLGKRNCLPVWHKFENLLGPEIIVADREGHPESANVVAGAQNIAQRGEELGLDRLKVRKRRLDVQKFLVDH